MTEGKKFYVLVHPWGEKSLLRVAEISGSSEFQLEDYDLASKRQFTSREEATEAGRKLASKRDLLFRES